MGLFPEWQYVWPMLFWMVVLGATYLCLVGMFMLIDKWTGHKAEPLADVLADVQGQAPASWGERFEQALIARYFTVSQEAPQVRADEEETTDAAELEPSVPVEAVAANVPALVLSSSEAAQEPAAALVPADSHAEKQPVPEVVPEAPAPVPVPGPVPAWEITVAMLATMRDPEDRTKYLFSVNEIKKKVRHRAADVGAAIAKYRGAAEPAVRRSTYTREDLALDAA